MTQSTHVSLNSTERKGIQNMDPMDEGNANINVLVTPSLYTKNENFEEANIVVSSLGEYEEPFDVIKGKAHGNKLVNIDLLNKIINH